MATINLLPQAATLKGRDKTLVQGLSKFLYVGFIILIAGGLALAGYFVFTVVRVRSSLLNEENLKAQVTTLSQTEQSYFLIKDRIAKIKSVLAKDSAGTQITILRALPVFVGENRVLEIQISGQKVTLALVFPSSASFGDFYKGLIESKVYKTVILKSFSFSPSVGYIATMELSNEK